jgi:AraC-like DNA-binding protein
VSQVINQEAGQTFSMLVRKYRIKEACRRLNDTQNYGHVTLETISESVGFKSRSTFVTAFKEQIGLTPSEYIKIATGK